MNEKYHQIDRDIYFRGKKVCTCYGTSEDAREADSEGFNRATEVCDYLNANQEYIELCDRIRTNIRRGK